MAVDALYSALNTIAQCAAALAALIGFFGLWTVERLRQEEDRVERELREFYNQPPTPPLGEDIFYSTRRGIISAVRQRVHNPTIAASAARLEESAGIVLDSMVEDLETLTHKRQQLMDVLVIFLLGTLAVLVIAIGLIPFAEPLSPRVWTMRLCIMVASLWLGIAPAYVVLQAAGGMHLLQQLWLRLAGQIQQAWSRVRYWHGPALVAARLRDRWRHQPRKSPP
jgi:hypothetical protein